MLRIFIAAFFACSLTSCGGPSASQEDVDTLKRRVANIEKRIRTFEGAGKARNKLNKGASKKGKGALKSKPAAGGSKVLLTGDIKRVALVSGKDRYPLPAAVPAGAYDIVGVTAGGDGPRTLGTAEIGEMGRVTVDCSAKGGTCTASIAK